MEETLVVIKPDAINRRLVGEVIKRLEASSLDIKNIKLIQVSREMAEKHYHFDDEDYLRSIGQKSVDAGDKIDDLVEQGRMIINAMCDFITSRPVVAMIIEGPTGTIAKVRSIVGYTDPAKAEKGTVRGDFGEDSILKANSEKRPVYNLVHASGNPQEAKVEIELWFPELSK